MVTLFLVFIITKGALTIYEGNTIESGAVRVGDTGQVKVPFTLISKHNLNIIKYQKSKKEK